MIDPEHIAQNLNQEKPPQVKDLVQKAVDKGQDVQEILSEDILAGMSVVGDKFKRNEFYVPEVLIAAISQSSLKGKVKVMVGGAPLTQDYAQEIGADGYAPDAGSAVDKAKELLRA